MQHLNYCRQMVKQFSATLRIPNIARESKQVLSHFVDLAAASTKFLLPEGGLLFSDKEWRGLDENDQLRLPYAFIALEWHEPTSKPEPGVGAQSTKRIVFARERDDGIVAAAAWWVDAQGLWVATPEFWIPRTHYVDRNAPKVGGHVCFKMACVDGRYVSDLHSEAFRLLQFLNALQCSNVGISKSPVSSTQRAIARRGALPFDEYHVLTLGNDKHDLRAPAAGEGHRSPREHLRRGHIRRYDSGLKVWVNATVVNPGVGGKVSKDYRLEIAA